MTDFTTGQWAYRGKPTEPVRVLETERPGGFPILTMDARGDLRGHFADGRWSSIATDGPYDLVPLQTPRPPVEGWVNVYPVGGNVHATRDEADHCAGPRRIACVFVREVEGGK